MTTKGCDFSTVTEVPGNLVTAEAIDQLWTRYAFAASLSQGKDVLEVACGPGPGLSYLASKARRVVGADYTHQLLRVAREHAGDRVTLARVDGQALPFASGSFDVVLLFEAIYYIPDARAFVQEAHRVLRPSGCVVIVSDNPAFPDFNPSPFTHRYFNSEELRTLLTSEGFDAAIRGSFAAPARSRRDALVSLTKRAAVRLRLVPRTMKGKERLKRLFYGRLTPFPGALADGAGTYYAPVPVPAGVPTQHHKLLFGIGTRR
jgi:SAM-dependent methyltransferase